VKHDGTVPAVSPTQAFVIHRSRREKDAQASIGGSAIHCAFLEVNKILFETRIDLRSKFGESWHKPLFDNFYLEKFDLNKLLL
jgi:hypothetical protein